MIIDVLTQNIDVVDIRLIAVIDSFTINMASGTNVGKSHTLDLSQLIQAHLGAARSTTSYHFRQHGDIADSFRYYENCPEF